MAYVRGNKEDFNEWAALGNNGWAYEDVLPYFKKSEHNENFGEPYHGKSGPLNVTHSQQPTPMGEAFIQACASNGIPKNADYNGAEQPGASMLQFTIKNNQRHSTATAFLKPVLHRKNLTVKTGSHVKRIIIEEGRATGVEVIHSSGNLGKYSCSREVILSAGAIQSPQVLMLSGMGDRDILESFGIPVVQHLPGVGQNLHDHIWTGVSGFTNIPMGNSLIRPWPMFKALLQHIFTKKGPLGNSPLEANAFLLSTPELNRPDLQFHMAPIAIAPGYTTDIYKLDSFAREDGYGILVILLRPHSRGYISIKSINPLDAPVIQPQFFSDHRDLETLLWALKKSIAVASDPALKVYAKGEIHFPEAPYTDDSLRTHIRKSLETLYHPVGTCKMGNDEMAVVDDQLKVRGIKGLRIADASIMPTIVSGNTNAACIMIGEKASDMILTAMEQ